MKSHRKPIFTLLLITPVLTELLSNNLPPSVLFNPVIFLFLATIGYGFPVLLLRELACRKRIGVAGLICLGLLYGIINEGIIAKTFYLAKDVPIGTFTGYGRVLGINVPWAILISTWHAFHALLYPIVIIYWLFPEHRDEPWLNRKATFWIAGVTAVLTTLMFFGHSKDRGPGLFPHYVLMLLCMGSLIWVALKVARPAALSEEGRFSLRPLGWGVAAFFGLFLVPVILCGAKAPVPVFYAYFALIFALVFRWLFRQPGLSVLSCLLFALGDDILFTLFAFIPAIQKASLERLVTNGVFLVVFACLIVRLRNGSRDFATVPA